MKSIIKIALETEKSGFEYFNTLANKCDYNEGVKNILTMLANAQTEQIKKLEVWDQEDQFEIDNSAFFDDSKRILQDLKLKIADFSCSIDHLSLYEHARAIQEEALKNYQRALSEIDSEPVILILNDLSAQKEKQIILLDNIIELLLRPEQWVESPEFTKLDDY